MEYGMKELCKLEGFDNGLDLIQNYMDDGGCPGICTKCGITYWVEHDHANGHCCCGSYTVQSAFILMGII